MFLRGLGSQVFNSGGYGNVPHASGSLGQIQGDTIRNITGDTPWSLAGADEGNALPSSALFWKRGNWGVNIVHRPNNLTNVSIDASRVVPTAVENRPVNVAVRYLIRASQ